MATNFKPGDICQNAKRFHQLPAGVQLRVIRVSRNPLLGHNATVERVDGGTFPVSYRPDGDRLGTIDTSLLRFVTTGA